MKLFERRFLGRHTKGPDRQGQATPGLDGKASVVMSHQTVSPKRRPLVRDSHSVRNVLTRSDTEALPRGFLCKFLTFRGGTGDHTVIVEPGEGSEKVQDRHLFTC